MTVAILLIVSVNCFAVAADHLRTTTKNPIQCVIDKDVACLNSFKGQPDNINLIGPFGRTALHYAAIQNNFEIVKQLIKLGASTETIDEYGNTPLISSVYVVRSRNPEINPKVVSLICEKTTPALRNHMNKNGADVLYYGIRYYSPEIVEALLKCGIKIKPNHNKFALKWLDERAPSFFSRDPISRQALSDIEAIKKLLIAYGLSIEP